MPKTPLETPDDPFNIPALDQALAPLKDAALYLDAADAARRLGQPAPASDALSKLKLAGQTQPAPLTGIAATLSTAGGAVTGTWQDSANDQAAYTSTETYTLTPADVWVSTATWAGTDTGGSVRQPAGYDCLGRYDQSGSRALDRAGVVSSHRKPL